MQGACKDRPRTAACTTGQVQHACTPVTYTVRPLTGCGTRLLVRYWFTCEPSCIHANTGFSFFLHNQDVLLYVPHCVQMRRTHTELRSNSADVVCVGHPKNLPTRLFAQQPCGANSASHALAE